MKRKPLASVGIFFAILQTSAANAWSWEFPVYVGAKYTHSAFTANDEKANVGLIGATLGFNHNDYIATELDFQTSAHDEMNPTLGKVDVSKLLTISLKAKYPIELSDGLVLEPNLKLGATEADLSTVRYGEYARSEFSWAAGFDLLIDSNATINLGYVNYMNSTIDNVEYDLQAVQVGYTYRF